MARYVAACEKGGVPAVALGFADQISFARNTALINGVPNIRWVDVPRVGSGEERVNEFLDAAIEAVTTPLTDKEKESGLYVPPPPARILFEGTLDDAQEFFQQTTPVANCRNCPIAKYTDGLPIIIPTEEKVSEMLTGTSHSPEEEIFRYTRDATTGQIVKGTTPVTYAGAYKATVEGVAVVAVMAGCKPEYLPVVLAVATSGGGSTNCPGTSGPYGYYFVVSGPIAKEIGMNAGQNALDVGNPANMTIVRSAALMTVNFGQCLTGAVRTDSGSMNRVAFAEDEEGMPTGWVTLGVEDGYKKTESVLGKYGHPNYWALVEFGNAPSSFRGLIGEGYGGIARYLGVEGIPGPHNFLAAILPKVIPFHVGGISLIMHPNMAKSLYDYGFTTKAAVAQWIYDTYYITQGEFEKYGWYDFQTGGGLKEDPITGIPYIDLPDSHQHHALGPKPDTCIIVSNGFADELCWVVGGASNTGYSARPTLYPIDPWR